MLGLTRSCLRSRSGCVSAFSPATAFARSGCVLRQLAQALRPAASAANTRTYSAAAEVLGQLVQALRPAASAANTRTYSAAAEITVREALNSALDEEISADPSVFLMGEEVGKYQGAYKISKDLLKSLR